MVNTNIRLIIYFTAKDGQFYTVSKSMTRSWLWLRQWTPDCKTQTYIEESRENHLAIQANQIPYDYTVEVCNRVKGLDLIDRVPEGLWTLVCDIV